MVPLAREESWLVVDVSGNDWRGSQHLLDPSTHAA